ncbi:MAG: YkgJ family cysteine cluster protein [Burkholderiaceae bacterium]|jgi:Fe-S-cluster containining protein
MSSSSKKKQVAAAKVNYDCGQCPGYCCSYPRIVVTDDDIKRLAKHLGLSTKKAQARHTRRYRFKSDDPVEAVDERILKHQKDVIYGSICGFFDTEERRCTIYEGRPEVCRDYPSGKTCGYFSFLKFERKQQGDKTFIPLVRDV